MQKYLIPKEGLIVRDPHSFNPLPETGAYVDWNGNAGRFWRRRVKQGDATIGKEPIKEIIEVEEPKTTSKRRSK